MFTRFSNNRQNTLHTAEPLVYLQITQTLLLYQFNSYAPTYIIYGQLMKHSLDIAYDGFVHFFFCALGLFGVGPRLAIRKLLRAKGRRLHGQYFQISLLKLANAQCVAPIL